MNIYDEYVAMRALTELAKDGMLDLVHHGDAIQRILDSLSEARYNDGWEACWGSEHCD